MAEAVGPVWIVAPDKSAEVDPGYDIPLPPEVENPDDPRPSHPIYIQPPGEEAVDPGYDIDEGEGWVRPDNTLPGDQPHPEHPIYLPPVVDNTLPDVEQPVEPEAPVDPGWGIDEEDGWLRPTHPIYLPEYPDNTLPPVAEEKPQPAGGLEFYQRKTVGIKWDKELLAPALVVGIYVMADVESDWVKVRTVPNDGTSSVTYPADFTGERSYRVASATAYCQGSYTVT